MAAESKSILEKYVDYVLEEEHIPKSIFKFCKSVEVNEKEFYDEYGSLEALRKSFWSTMVHNTKNVLHKDENYETYDSKNKLLSFYYTLFENFSLYRSYILFTADKDPAALLSEAKVLRKAILPTLKEYASSFNNLAHHLSDDIGNKISEEALWLQFMGILKFWMKDTSKGFESTDAFIEKSVRVAYDLTEKMPLESVIDYGKFLFHEMKSQL